MFNRGERVKRKDIKGRIIYIVRDTDSYGWTYCYREGGNPNQITTFLPGTLKRLDNGSK